MYFTHPQLKNLKPLFKKTSEAALRKKLANFFPNRHIVFTNLGRSAFQVAIKELELENSEMLVPAYICDIFKPIFKHYNIKPIYLDIDLKTFNIDPTQIEKKITLKTKSILISHTYGLPNDMDKIFKIAKKHNLKIIEDCAQAFGVKYQHKYLGNFGDCAFFSLPKICPSINGGMLVCSPSHQKLFGVKGKKPTKADLKKYRSKPSNLIKFARLCPCLATFSEKFRKNIGILSSNEYSIPRRVSKISLKIFNWYLDNFEEQISKRKELAEYLQENLQKLGFQISPGITYISALVPENINRDELFKKLRKKNIFCSRVWHKPIIPIRQLADYPNTSKASKQIINFPLQNWFEKRDLDKIIKKIKTSFISSENKLK